MVSVDNRTSRLFVFLAFSVTSRAFPCVPVPPFDRKHTCLRGQKPLIDWLEHDPNKPPYTTSTTPARRST